jgi:UDPglucose 6-dehydrogenase
VDFGILNEVAKINHEARRAVVEKVRDALWHLDGKRVGMLGLSFKPDTDDLREAPAIDVARDLLADGAHAVVVMTEWAEFGKLEPADLRARMAYPILVDARNALDAKAFLAAGFTVAGVGRPVRSPGGSR